MILLDLLAAELRRLHDLLDSCAADLTSEQWHLVPAGNPRANTIAFDLWHYTRTEDNIVRFILQERRPTVWLEDGWADRFGLPPVAQGTGMRPEEAQRLRIEDTDAFRAYMQAVWQSTHSFLQTAGSAQLDEPVLVRPLGQMPGAQALGQVCVSHGFGHYGEIELCRTLMGLPPAGDL